MFHFIDLFCYVTALNIIVNLIVPLRLWLLAIYLGPIS